jgi:carbonic anhydrase
MDRRHFIKALTAMGACPLCANRGLAAEWSYAGRKGPERWGELSRENLVCATGTEQSPLDIVGAVKAELPSLAIAWQKGGGTMINNGHTIEVEMPSGSRLTRGGREYELKQFHFHAPSEHHVDGRVFPMEAHFVHRHLESDALGVLAILLTPGAANSSFARFAAAFPRTEGVEICAKDVDPSGLLPRSLDYWLYEGSLTTPPCSETVDWMVAMEPLEVAAADIERFTTLYPSNARPVRPPNRRFILSST